MLENERDSILKLSVEELREGLGNLGIKAVLFDLDDTLIYTSEIFMNKMNQYVEKVAAETGLDNKILNESVRRLNDEGYVLMGVNPARWEEVVQKMSEEFMGNESSILANLDILMSIYTEEPRVRLGAKDMLATLRAAGIKVGLVTHANVDWTWRKLAIAGMTESFDSVVIADENGHKKVEHWEMAMNNLGVSPKECLVIGDSLGGDIFPTAKIGAKTMWIHNELTWSFYDKDEVPEGVVIIDEVNELLSALARLG